MPASRHTCRGGDQEGSGTTSGVRGDARGGRAEVIVIAGGGCAFSTSKKQIEELVRERDLSAKCPRMPKENGSPTTSPI